MTKKAKWLVGAGSVAAVAAVAVLVRPPGVQVEVATVVRDTLSVTVEEEGRTRARNRYVVGAPVTGRLSRTDVEEGTRVERGDTLGTISPPPEDTRTRAALRAALDVAQARERQAEAGLNEAAAAAHQARREVERRRTLLDMGALTQEAFERFEEVAETAEARHNNARASHGAALAEVRAARSRLLGAGGGAEGGATEPITTPVAGTVLRVHEENERVVQAGTPLFEIAGEGGLEIIVDLLTEDAVAVKAGDPVRIRGWGRDELLEGAVQYVEPAAFTKVSALGVEEQRVNVVGTVHDAPSSLGVGFRVDVAIVTWMGTDVVSVPTSAIFRRGGGWRTFVVEGGRARMRPVEIGRRSTERAQVLGGLEPGEQVIMYPSDLVSDGTRVSANGA